MSDQYAILRTGGKQYRVTPGDKIHVELLPSSEGDKVEFDEVLFYTDGKASKVGAPKVEGCMVVGKHLGEVRGPKVIAFKYKRRQNYRRKVGHRQNYARVEITAIEGV